MPKPQFICSVMVQPLPDKTNAEQHVHAFSYTVLIENTGETLGQVIGRHWEITDAHGTVQRVDGLAVVGHQPVLVPGQHFQYSSWAQIATPQGSMRGRLLCVSETAEVFYADVPEFMLTDTASLH